MLVVVEKYGYVFPNKPIIMQPTKIRMGLGKGSPKYWVFVVKQNRIHYEICGVPKFVAKATMKITTYKMFIHIQFVTFISDTNMNDG
jgi:ribosomal protein L16